MHRIRFPPDQCQAASDVSAVGRPSVPSFTSGFLAALECTEFVLGQASPRTPLGSSQHSPYMGGGRKGRRGRGGRVRERRRGDGREGGQGRVGEGREERGEEGTGDAPLTQIPGSAPVVGRFKWCVLTGQSGAGVAVTWRR